METILGLDLGTNSIGWGLVKHDINNNTGKIIDAGSRIIPMSQDVLGIFDSGQSYSQTAERTSYRGIRRLRERNLLRRERIHRVLNILGFLPEHYALQIDFKKNVGQFLKNTEPKLPYQQNKITQKPEFLFIKSFEEMLSDFKKHQPLCIANRKIPYDWTIYYLRKKALTDKIEKEELAWLLLNFNQKRGYYQLRGEEEEENKNKLVEFHSLLVNKVTDSGDKKAKDETWYNVHLENGWIYRRTSKIPLDWVGKTKEFVVTTDLNDDGTIKKDKEGKEKRSFRAPAEDDWTLVKTKTEKIIDNSKKTVGAYIYDALLQNPNQKIKGKLVRTIERKFYKEELHRILEKQKEFHAELRNENLYNVCLEELYENNEAHRNSIAKKDFTHLFLNDIIFYQRPLKSKKSLISDCRYESRSFKNKDGITQIQPVKCIAKSHPLFQEFRLWKWIKNVNIYEREKLVDGKLQTDVNVTAEFIKNEEDIVNLFEFLNKRKEIDQKAFLKYFGKAITETKYRWNNVEEKTYPCNETRAMILSRLAKVENVPVDFLNKENEEALWHILYSVTDKNEIQKALKTFADKKGLSEDFVEHFRKFPPFKNEYGSYSAKAIKKLLPLMRVGKLWNEKDIHSETKERINKIMNAEYDAKIKDRVREKAINLSTISAFKNLPEWLSCYIIYNRHSEEGEITKWKTPADIESFLKNSFRQHSLRNPIVEQVITETLRVVNDIWKKYGNSAENFFDEIHIELGREMKNPADARQQMTKQITANENTNLRIKALLIELLNDKEVENVRPYSPMQQEILKIYEDGVLNSESEIPEDILKISKAAQPSSSELIRYKLWLEQKYRSPYTGQIIPLSKLFTPAYEIEHIIPQSRFFDDAFSNKVICESEVNKDKDNSTAYEYIKNNRGKKIELSALKTVTLFTVEAYEDFVKQCYSKNRSKMKKLLMDEIPEKMIERQLNDTRYISKFVKNLLSNIVREKDEQETTSKNVIASKGNITSVLKQDWGLNDVWNDIITPRFQRLNEITNSTNFGSINPNTNKFLPQVPLEKSKGFSKKRIDHRHHAMDALIIACASRSHINFLNNEYAKEKTKDIRYDLRSKLCSKKYNDESKQNYKWVFNKPWMLFTQEAKEVLTTTVISFKQNLRVINKTVNKYEKWRKDETGKLIKQKVKQEKGDSWAIRKPMHKDTVSGSVQLRFKKIASLTIALDNWKMITEKSLKQKIKTLFEENNDKKQILKYFKDLGFKWNEKDISKVEVYYLDDGNVASRVNVDETFDTGRIQSITDTGIQKIMTKHLEKNNNQPELAFSPDGIDEMNKTLVALNDGSFHFPIYKVRTYEPKGNKFAVGTTGNKKDKFVEAAKGTNLFFAVYQDEKGKRNFETIPLHVIIERQKQGLSSVPETNDAGDKLLFHLSPNDLAYIPSIEEKENITSIDFSNLSKEQVTRIYKIVSFTNNRLYAIPNPVAVSIVDKAEFTQLNKLEFSLDKQSIKEHCIKLKIDRLGNIQPINLFTHPSVQGIKMNHSLSELTQKKEAEEAGE